MGQPPGQPQGQTPTGEPPPPPSRIAPGQRPPRAFRGLFGGPRTVDPTRTRTELSLSANLMGGYDDNVAGGTGGGGGGVIPDVATSGSVASGDAAIDYFYGNDRRSVRVEGGGNLQALPGYLDGPVAGAHGSVAVSSQLGRRQTLSASQSIRSEPLFTFGRTSSVGVGAPTTGAPTTGAPTPGVGPVGADFGLFERRSVATDSTVGLDRRWTRRDSTQLSYGYRLSRFTSDEGGDSRTHTVSGGYSRAVSRRLGLRAGYAYAHGNYDDLGGTTRPTRQHLIEGGPEYTRPLSSRRNLALSLSGGASRIESVRTDSDEPYTYWAPFAAVAATVSLADEWSLGATYRRGLSVLDGLTGESYYADSASVSLGGLLTSRTDLSVTGHATAGRTAVASGSDSDYRVVGASVQLSFALTRTIAATGSYHYYYHRYSNVEDLPVGFPPTYDRNSVRVGLTMWVPLRGSFARR